MFDLRCACILKKDTKRAVFWAVVGIAFLSALIWASVAGSKGEFLIDRVVRTSFLTVQETEYIWVRARSEGSFFVVPSLQVWNGKRWTVPDREPELEPIMVDPVGEIRVPVPARGTPWRIKLLYERVRKVSFCRRSLERVGILRPDPRVEYLPSRNS